MNLERIKMRCIECGDCLLWTGTMKQGDQPVMRLAGQRNRVNVRRYYAELLGRKVDGKMATASCNRKNCIAPEHILLLTRSELNARIAKVTKYAKSPLVIKNRSEIQRRKSNLTINDIRAIRESSMDATEAANLYGTSRGNIWNIRTHRTWRETATPWAGLL